MRKSLIEGHLVFWKTPPIYFCFEKVYNKQTQTSDNSDQIHLSLNLLIRLLLIHSKYVMKFLFEPVNMKEWLWKKMKRWKSSNSWFSEKSERILGIKNYRGIQILVALFLCQVNTKRFIVWYFTSLSLIQSCICPLVSSMLSAQCQYKYKLSNSSLDYFGLLESSSFHWEDTSKMIPSIWQ